jgi:MIP family channel proteins
MKDAPARLLAEFLGVFFLCLFGIGAIMNGVDITGVALAHGLAIFIAICAFAHISGAHFNPAVTIALAATERIAPVDAVAYIVAQLIGAAAAAAVLKSAFGTLGGVPALADGVTTSTGILIEAVATFILMIVIMGVAVDSRGTFSIVAGLPIGMAIVGDIFFAGPATGAAMNPARWFGPALVTGDMGSALIYLVGPIVGALVAVFVYDLVMKPAKI